MDRHYWKTAAENAIQSTTEFVNQFGPRLTGADSTRQTAAAIHKSLKNICDRSAIDKFSVHPRSFLDWIRILVVVYLLSIGLLWIKLPAAAFLLLLVGLLIMVFQFFLYQEIVDPLFKKEEGQNVWGIIEPQAEVQQQVIISGHHDSARIFNFFIHQPKLYSLRVMGGIGSLVLLFVYALVYTIIRFSQGAGFQIDFSFLFSPTVIVFNGLFSLLFLLVGQLWFFASDKGTPGAGDNMIATAIALEVGKHFAALKPQHTRIYIVSFDAEEAGLRGARAFFKQHRNEFAQYPAWHFNIDCPYTLKDFFFLTTDINGNVKLSLEMADKCVETAHELGYPSFSKPITFLTGGTDAAESAKIGIKATTLMGMPWGNDDRAAVYHTPLDLPEAIEPQAVQAAIEIATSFISKIDQS